MICGFVGSDVPGPVESVRSLEFLPSTCSMREPNSPALTSFGRDFPQQFVSNCVQNSLTPKIAYKLGLEDSNCALRL
jgi:hypothetical protein